MKEERTKTLVFGGSQSPDQDHGELKELIKSGFSGNYITPGSSLPDLSGQKGNVENFIGYAAVPIGLTGPLLLKHSDFSGKYYVPLATTEGALVASYNRGMKICRLSGGINVRCLDEGVQRSPFFKFKSLDQAIDFKSWVEKQLHEFDQITSTASRYAKLKSVEVVPEGNAVIVVCSYYTGDAAGQNMVTICTEEICKFILDSYAVQPSEWYVESNFSGDKKATTHTFTNVRGKKVSAEVTIPKELTAEHLHASPDQITKYWRSSTLSSIQSGAIGSQGHVANGLTALYIACGQDVASIAESAMGITRMEVDESGDLYASLTLPSLIVGTVGGGTDLATQKECLELMGCYGEGKARKFASICTAVALAGEISIAGALAVDEFTKAHRTLGRKSGGK